MDLSGKVSFKEHITPIFDGFKGVMMWRFDLTNYDPETIDTVSKRLSVRGVMIDCSHGNSRKNPARQSSVLREVATHVRGGATGVLGVMLESHIHAGRQDWKPGRTLEYGVSITDGCIGFPETEVLLRELAAAVRPITSRRTAALRMSAA